MPVSWRMVTSVFIFLLELLYNDCRNFTTECNGQTNMAANLKMKEKQK